MRERERSPCARRLVRAVHDEARGVHEEAEARGVEVRDVLDLVVAVAPAEKWRK
jgi:hypothetical protein